MRTLQLSLVAVLLLATPAWTQNETTTTTTTTTAPATNAPNALQQGWDNIVSSTTSFWGNLMGWGSTDQDEEATTNSALLVTNSPTAVPKIEEASEIEASGTPLYVNGSVVEATGTALTSTATSDSEVPEDLPAGNTDVDLYPDDWDMSVEEQDLGEYIWNVLTVLIPEIAHATVCIFGTWIQIFINHIQRGIVRPVFNALGSFFDIPLGTAGFDVPAIVSDFAEMIIGPLKDLNGMALDGLTMGVDFLKPILGCIGKSVKASQELLIGIFQIFPVCVTNLTYDVIQIIVDTMAVIEGLSSVFTAVMNTLNACMINPMLCIVVSIFDAFWAITKATVSVSQNAVILVDLLPTVGNTATECLAQNTAQLMQKMPDILDGFLCRA